jgi:hypothetical protein
MVTCRLVGHSSSTRHGRGPFTSIGRRRWACTLHSGVADSHAIRPRADGTCHRQHRMGPRLYRLSARQGLRKCNRLYRLSARQGLRKCKLLVLRQVRYTHPCIRTYAAGVVVGASRHRGRRFYWRRCARGCWDSPASRTSGGAHTALGLVRIRTGSALDVAAKGATTSPARCCGTAGTAVPGSLSAVAC